MKKACQILLLFFCFSTVQVYSQEPISIKVRKEQSLVKAYFDNTELRLSAIDKYGNPKNNKILSFKLWVKGNNRSIAGFDNALNSEMIQELNRQKKATKIFFTEIVAEDDEGHSVKLPDLIEVWFPQCTNCDVVKKKKR